MSRMSDLILSQAEINALLGGTPLTEKPSHQGPTQVLTREEIDELLTTISGSADPELWVDRAGKFVPDQFFTALRTQSLRSEPVSGMFTKDALVVSLHSTKNGDQVLADLIALNKKEGGGTVSVPGTDLQLVNFSRCPTCGTLFSAQDLRNYYRNPVPATDLAHRHLQLRQDPRVVCHECSTAFLPSLVIADSLPRNEVPFLCRLQTIHAVEVYMKEQHERPVLSQVASNVRTVAGKQQILNDLSISQLAPKPGLILNILQYSTVPAQLHFLDGSNREHSDLIFGHR